MTPDQTAQLESLVSEIRDVDARFEPALAAQKEANETVDALTLEQEAAREAYEKFMWQLKDDPDLLNPAVAAEPAPVVDDAPPVEETPEPAPADEAPPADAPATEPTPEPTVAEQNTTPTV